MREKDFRTGKLNLAQIPLDHHSRIAVRLYGPDSEAMPVSIRLYGFGDPKPPIAQAAIQLVAPPCSTDPCDAMVPSFAMIPDLEEAFPQIAQLDRVRIEIEPGPAYRFWAFATVTNNQTQHITIVTPQ